MQYTGQPNPRAAADTRLKLVAAALLLWGGAIIHHLYLVQIKLHDHYSKVAVSQQEHDVKVPAPRGTIFDRNGQQMAVSVPAESVAVDPRRINNVSVATEVMGNLLHLDKQILHDRLAYAREHHKGFVMVKRHMDPFEAKNLRDLHLEYASFIPESRRNYPNGITGAHVVGDVCGKEGADPKLLLAPHIPCTVGEEGGSGIERSFDALLRGESGEEHQIQDVRRKGIDSHVDTAVRAGTPLTLTIDERLQFIAERELKKGVEAKHARYGTAIVMDPYTGDILALANYPSYDPNKPPSENDSKWSRFNLGVSVPFEPGSIFKVVTLSAALETTNLTPDSPIATGNGTLSLPGRVVHEAHGGYGTISMQQVLEKSSNIGAIKIGQRVGREKMYEYVKRFGFGDKTGAGFPAESRGLFRPLNKWGSTSLESIAMGQEVSATSVQLARAASVFANGGMLVRPRIILKRGDKLEPVEPPVRVLKPETVMKMRIMMEGVVLRGTARLTARLDGYTSAGKTGTAQIFEHGHYTHLYNASFMGFAPVTNPRLVILVTLNGTEGNSGMGGAAAAPVFKEIATEAMRMLDVPKDIPEDEVAAARKAKIAGPLFEEPAIADLSGSSIMAEDPSLRELLAEQAIIAGNSHTDAIEDGIPAAGTVPRPLLAAEAASLPVPAPPKPTGPVVPDFRGKSMQDVVEMASADGLSVQVEGSGVARAQIPGPGMPVRRGARIRVVFTR